ncbi:hypothetical protein [Leptospira vanthielii]|uniref:DUF4386 domain-containing protein n=1 Tax=Leptospira vanthielii TaxID=293085 RepID=A0ABY2NPW7_9LEPT|nr:hypothetical protein [Leptospira vanthielii]TGM58150.1 hypothetical protein EHQ95_07715 [Leptospira vanthielii]
MAQIKNLNSIWKGFPFFIASLLFATYFVLSYLVPSPPSDTAQLHSWITEWKTFLQIADEILIFATLSLLPSIYTLANPIKENQPPLVLFASGLFFLLVVPMFVLVDLLLGRLVYPVNVYPLAIDTIVFILSLIAGTMHMISLVLALAILLFSISFRKKTWGSLVLVIGIFVFGFQITASYPWLVSPGVLLLCQLSFPIWLLSIGFYFAKNEKRFPKRDQTELS